MVRRTRESPSNEEYTAMPTGTYVNESVFRLIDPINEEIRTLSQKYNHLNPPCIVIAHNPVGTAT